MFQHAKLDGEWCRLIPAMESFTQEEVLEIRESHNSSSAPEAIARTQYAVIEGRLAERSLPPESIGDTWSFDPWDKPWWGLVNNPPHAGLVADFNSYSGGAYRKALDKENDVKAWGGAGEPVTFADGMYIVVRQKDGATLTAPTVVELRKLYYAD